MKLATSNTSQVRVGVRVRPLTHQEVGQGGKMVLTARAREIQLGDRRFTYDAVFDSNISQENLYTQVSAPLQNSFLDGYNATIMAYGQTGSGKTFTMGSEAHMDLELTPSTGLIPRFMNDLFAKLEAKKKDSSLLSYSLKASFLEVYGEDIHDLLDPSRKSLPLREDSSGGVVCAGLTDRPVTTAAEALKVLHEGTMNRTTAATLMNLTSSRSHAVFTVTLRQITKEDGIDVTCTNRFTFVDLAGSERMKKTGAEGERAREGIKINEGLLALGNVINALADEERLSGGKKVHVPYRQSKLTRLLQDALGGNSQTLFLACVSPSDMNASETLSTLHYANRARNIKNAPTKNADASQLELRRLQAFNRVLQNELVMFKFNRSNQIDENFLPPSDEMMMRRDVNDYLERLHTFAQEASGLCPQPLRLGESSIASSGSSIPFAPSGKTGVTTNVGVALGKPLLDQCDPDLLTEVNPDEEMAILNQLLELQQKDQEHDNEQKKEAAELEEMDGELAEQEAMLLQLRDSLKVYHDMKTKYEKLMTEVQQLEVEKAQLAEQLEKATADPTQGCSTAIKKELEKVERSLVRARTETRKHRHMYQKAEQEAQRCRTLERTVADLKNARASLMKRHKAAATRHREYTESKTREILQLKRRERVTNKKMSKLETEIQIHKKNLEKRQSYNRKLSDKLKQTESHLMKLLSMRRQESRKRSSIFTSARRASMALPSTGSRDEESKRFADADSAELKSLEFMIGKGIADKVNHDDLRCQYEERVEEYTQLMRSIVEDVGKLESEQNDDDVRIEIEEKELKIELLATEMESLRAKIADAEKGESSSQMSLPKKLIEDKDAPLLRSIILSLVHKFADVKLALRKSASKVELKDSVIKSFENEVESLNTRISSLTQQVARYHSLQDDSRNSDDRFQLQEERESLIQQNRHLEEESARLRENERMLVKEVREITAELDTARERATLAEVALEQQSGDVKLPSGILEKTQKNWGRLGLPSKTREEKRDQLENCLEMTCITQLQESENLVQKTEEDIADLESEIRSMSTALGIDTPLEGGNPTFLLDRLEVLQKNKNELEPRYVSAKQRREALSASTKTLAIAMGMTAYDKLDPDLQALLVPSGTEEACATLSDTFLDRCESLVSELRLEKSKILANNSKLQKKALTLVTEMNLSDHDVLTIVVHSIKQRCSTLPEWWNDELSKTVAQVISMEGGVVRSTFVFAQHLQFFLESLESISSSRRLLSTKLRDIVMRAQKTLLETVDGGDDAAEAYSSFHDALFRLPPLSKEHVHACILEIRALVNGVEAMTQSEIEALTVVWEALNISMASRGDFWGKIEEPLLALKANPQGPFYDIAQSSSIDSEEWVLAAVKDITQSYVELESRLYKLEKIHEEVERMSARQDGKSRILSLDSEIRILSSKLTEFEEQKCDKERLVSKKSTSSNLLKEERFRKQMQSKFSSKLEQLAELLKKWRTEQNEIFEPNLLSEEVRDLLANTDDEIDVLVEKRTEFMHLRTTLAGTKLSSKRRHDSVSNTQAPPTKRRMLSTTVPKASPVPKPVKTATITRKQSGPASSSASQRSNRQSVDPSHAHRTAQIRAEENAPPRTRKRRVDHQAATSPARLPKYPPAARAVRSGKREETASSKKGSTRRVPLSPSTGRNVKDSRNWPKEKKRLTLPPFGHVLEQAITPKKSKENTE